MRGKSWIVVVGIIVVLAFVVFGQYNRLVGLNEGIDGQWAQVENQYQRRFDLIPNLVETVKGFAAHEQEAIDSVTAARARLAGAGTVDARAQATTELESALARLLVVVENYPNLKADAHFTQLMDELAGTENRISVERQRYNEQVQTFNRAVKTFPAVLFAKMLGFEARTYFAAPEAAQQPPKVQF